MLKSSASLTSVLMTKLTEVLQSAPADVSTARAFRRTFNPLFLERPLLELCSKPYSSRSEAYAARSALIEQMQANVFFQAYGSPKDPVIHAQEEGFVMALSLDKDKVYASLLSTSTATANSLFHQYLKEVDSLLSKFSSSEAYQAYVSDKKDKEALRKRVAAQRNRAREAKILQMLAS